MVVDNILASCKALWPNTGTTVDTIQLSEIIHSLIYIFDHLYRWNLKA